jgi:ribosome maturation factor RimP
VPETLGKQSAEDLLRRYMEESSAQHAAARYLLAAMLERKRLLKEVEAKTSADGQLLRIYEHTKTGEVFIIPDPGLRLDQIAQVQQEVSALLDPGSPT